MRHYSLPVFATLVLLAASGSAWAHAHLVTATPAPDSTVQAAPNTLTITFTEGVEPAFSSITVQDANGHRVDTGAATTSPTDAKRLSIAMQPLQPGTYKVTWLARAVDTHKTDGMFHFTVKP